MQVEGFGGNDPEEPGGDAVRQQLGRILESHTFAHTRRLSVFLTYIVEAALSGSTRVSESALATQVFGRGSDFDPKLDPVVRVQARRLRAKLARYYAVEGIQDRVEIDLPLRRYLPSFRARSGLATYAAGARSAL